MDHPEVEGDDELLQLIKQAQASRRLSGHRPVPVLVDGKVVDLKFLLKQAKSLGGYDNITREKAWKDISTALGFGSDCGASLKLVYVKYLKALESGNALKVNEQTRVRSSEDSKDGGKRRKVGGKENLELLVQNPKNVSVSEKDVKESLIWLKRVALNPGDALAGEGAAGSSQDKQWAQNCAKMIAKARQVLSKKDEELLNRRARYHLRRKDAQQNSSNAEDEWRSCSNIGPEYQADVQPQNFIYLDDDEDDEENEEYRDATEFLGELVWESKKEDDKNVLRSCYLHTTCSCFHKGSVDCVKLHVQQQKDKLAIELGEEIFRRWGFDKMGESAASDWTAEDQKKFEAIFSVPGEEDYWKNLAAAFPNKSRAELVSYYYNVFVLKRQGKEPDSDEEEK